MIVAVGAGILVIGFVLLSWAFRLVPTTKQIMLVANEVLATVRSSTLSDREKETAMRRSSISLFKLAAIAGMSAAGALGLPYLALWGLDRAGLLDLDASIAFVLSWPFLAATPVIVVLVLIARSRSARDKAAGRYSWVDRLLHRIAFASWPAQLALADMEDRMHARRLAPLAVSRPVFITGLPRAGTTLLLELCVGTGEFATHTYRHMPFVLVPMLWSQFSGQFSKQAESIPRAHGDGMMVSADSPESFEEMVWRPFWSAHYQKTRIVPWTAEDNPAFTKFFVSHMRKLIALQPEHEGGYRYISKNNLNISRIDLIARMFPDATIVVPFRAPIQHAISLLRQHVNFVDLHRDPFARRYMAAVGHYDFGLNLRPIDFGGWLPRTWKLEDRSLDATTLEFWLRYWTAAYRAILQVNADVQLMCYEDLCEDPAGTLTALATRLAIREPGLLVKAGQRVTVAPERNVDSIDANLRAEAAGVYDEMRRRAVRADSKVA